MKEIPKVNEGHVVNNKQSKFALSVVGSANGFDRDISSFVAERLDRSNSFGRAISSFIFKKFRKANSSSRASCFGVVNCDNKIRNKRAITICQNSKMNSRINNKFKVVQPMKELREYLAQLHLTRQSPIYEDDSPARPSVFSRLLFVQPTLRLLVTIPKRS